MKLLRLEIDNFKGIARFRMDIDGRNATVYGANGSGKTSVYDAFLWLLFGKDSQERSDFAIKPLDRLGNVAQHGAEVSVAATVEHKGRTLALRKTYREKWVKQRGSAQEVFTGHESACFVDDVPVTARAYCDAISALLPEKIFRAITNPRWFCGLKWQERRDMLFEMGGAVPADDLFDGELARLREAAQGRSIEDFRTVLQASARKHNQELRDLPIRIDEAQRALVPEAENGQDVDGEIATLTRELNVLAQAPKQDSLALERDALAIELKNLQADNDHHILQQKRTFEQDKQARAHDLQCQIQAIYSDIELVGRVQRRREEEARTAELTADALREQWLKLSDQTYESATRCYVCGQKIPVAAIEAARQQFDSKRQEDLDACVEQGREAMRALEEARNKAEQHLTECDQLKARMKELSDAVCAVESEVKSSYEYLPGFTERRDALQARIDEINLALEAPGQAEPDALRTRKDALCGQIDTLEAKRHARRKNAEVRARIAELEARQAKVAQSYEEAAYLLGLCEEYTRRHMSLTEERINGLFSIVRWKLFETQVNGGIADTCIPCVNGVPYSDLNNAMRVNAGLDIIVTLSRYYGVTAPIFIDNAESVTELLPMEAQRIRLVVTEHDKALRVA